MKLTFDGLLLLEDGDWDLLEAGDGLVQVGEGLVGAGHEGDVEAAVGGLLEGDPGAVAAHVDGHGAVAEVVVP